MNRPDIKDFDDAVAYLYDMPRFTGKNTIEDTKSFLKKLGNPDEKMKIIHVAGTNGKGSVCAYMKSVLEESGKTVSLFTSPHLVDIRERFIINKEMISKESFFSAFIAVLDKIDFDGFSEEGGYHPTFFEYLFFMAMLLFKDAASDYCILETGLGGRLDATNSVGLKELCVITSIGLDHVEYLGDTIEKIAGEKAGIIRSGCPVVFSDSSMEAAKVIVHKAKELGAETHLVSNKDYALIKIQNKSIDFSINTRYYGYVTLTASTIAAYQMENISLAVRAIEVLDKGRSISNKMLTDGIRKCIWQGRMEEVLPEVFVDGAHNEDGIRAFIETVANDGFDGRRKIIFSAVADKDCERMVGLLTSSHLFEGAAITKLKTNRAADVNVLASFFEKYKFTDYNIFENAKEALEFMVHNQKGGERIYIAGSLYLAGEIKELLCNDKF